MQLLRHACAIRHRLDVAVARQQQLPVQRLQHLGAPLRRIGPRHQLQQRVHIVALRIILHHQRQRRRRFGNQLHTAKADRIAAEPRARQRHGITRAPRHPPRCLIGHHRPCRTGLLLRGILPATASKEIQDHRFAPHLSLAGGHTANHPAPHSLRRGHPPTVQAASCCSIRDRHPRGIAVMSALRALCQQRVNTDQSDRTPGRRQFAAGTIISSCSAHTSASTRSGDPVPSNPRAVIFTI